jgi:hypothetical protein
MRDRVIQMAALLIPEPIFEADFEDCRLWVPAGAFGRDPTKQFYIRMFFYGPVALEH